MTLADKQLGRFLSYVSHEIRSPVSSMMTLCEVLEAGVYGEVNQRQQQALQELQSYGNHFLRLLGDVIELAKATQGKLAITPEIIELKDFLKEIEYLSQESLLKKQQRLQKNATAHIEHFIADSKRLKQIMLFMLEQTMLSAAANTELNFNIHLQQQQIIFSLHHQNPCLNVEEQQTAGLNLTFAQQLARLMGGQLVYKNNTATACFKLMLPFLLAKKTAEEHAAKPLTLTYTHREQLIVIASSDSLQAHALADFFLRQGYRVKLLFNGAEVVQQALHTLPALIIADIELPDLDGFAIARQILSNQETQAIPIVLCSVETDSHYETRAKQAGAAYLAKPFSLSSLQSFL